VFQISAIPAETLRRFRETGLGDNGTPWQVEVDDGGSPLRCCLRPADPGERLALVAYRPDLPAGPFAEVGPVLVHADACPGYRETGAYPERYRDWPTMVFRPYYRDGGMAYPAISLVDGPDAERAIAEIFADPDIDRIHTRNVRAGCYMFAIHRDNS
jgi:hypothetical protein